jgi:antirestriction protein ArdC
MAQPKSTPRDFRQEVTDNIITLLEQGAAPWQKPWDDSMSMPMNPTTGKAYRGGNVIHLLAVGMSRGLSDPRWMTYKQAQEKGWQVRKGERGTQIEFWDVKRTADGQPIPQAPEGEGNPEQRQSRLIHRVYTVFNASQVEGVPPIAVVVREPFEVVEAGERILSHSGAAILHDQNRRAFYNRRTDSIHLPQKTLFPDAESYYGTALHELGHWTGHPSRLDRSTLTQSYTFGDTNYAQEELRAELASLFLAAERGIPHDPMNHAAYVGSWIKALKSDKNEIFRAAADASKMTDYLLDLEQKKAEELAQQEPVGHADRETQRRAAMADRAARR